MEVDHVDDNKHKRAHSDSESISDTDNDDTPISQIMTKSKHKKSKSKSGTTVKSQSGAIIDDTIDVVINGQINHPGAIDIDLNLKVTKLQSEVKALSLIVSTQAQTITALTLKLSSVLSYLEIDGSGVDEQCSSAAAAAAVDQPGFSSSDVQPAPSSSAAATATFAKNSYAIVVASPTGAGKRVSTNIADKRKTTAATSTVAAVYMEEQNRKRRATSLVISGLPPVGTSNDETVFTNLCESEFQVKPVVVSTKRLGHPQPNRIQPLLVTLRNEDTAHHLIREARRLRNSTNSYTRSYVYINPNRTRAESEAAYQLRVLRRQAAEKRSSKQQVEAAKQQTSSTCGTVQQQTFNPPTFLVVPAGLSSSPAAAAAVGGRSVVQQQQQSGTPSS